jgi:hypothetical protein
MHSAHSHSSFKWVESPQHGAGGPNWVEVRMTFLIICTVTELVQNHIEAYISIAGTHLVRSSTHPASAQQLTMPDDITGSRRSFISIHYVMPMHEGQSNARFLVR